MNITDRAEFYAAIEYIRKAQTVVFDTETNGLHIHQDSRMISISIYLPETDQSFNFAFRHGEGYVEGTVEDFDAINWQGDAKKRTYLAYWFDRIKDRVNFENLPIEWLEDLKAVWGKPGVLYVAHNSKFDLHVLANEGFPEPEMVHDTMVALHTIHEDWRGIQFTAPFKWALKDKTAGLCPASAVGTWAKDAQGKLITKKQYGNRELKWQSARLGLPGATDGETGLRAAVENFEEILADFVLANWTDDYNKSLITAAFRKAEAKGTANWDDLRSKFRAKIEVDDKANMWMLPSSYVAPYAELDTKLTWGLYQWCLKTLVSWANEKLFLDVSRVQYHLAYRMERNGFKVDVATAQAELEKLQPRIADLSALISQITVGICWEKPELIDSFGATGCNIDSPKQLLAFLNSGILAYDLNDELWPKFWDQEFRVDLITYEDAYFRATDKPALEPYEDSAIVRIIREQRRMNKSANTYLTNWLNARDKDDIVRFSFDATGTGTGRMSSSGDAGNGQNIPDRNGYTIKRAIVPYAPNWKLFAIDYSQLELRLAAWIAEGLLKLDHNMTMTNLFISGNDMHQYVSDMVNIRGILFDDMDARSILIKLGYSLDSIEMNDPEREVKSFCRKQAKVMNFGLLYSGTEKMLAKLLHIPKSTAKVLVDRWRKLFPAFPQAQEYYTKAAQQLRNRPVGNLKSMYVTQPISGRHRRIDMYERWMEFWQDGVKKGFNPQQAEAAKTWNSTVQGLGGYLCTMSGAKFVEEYGNENIKLFAQIHDALEGFVDVGHMQDVNILANYMKNWPEIVPALDVAIQGSKDGTWQGMTEIVDMPLWVSSEGVSGYPVKNK